MGLSLKDVRMRALKYIRNAQSLTPKKIQVPKCFGCKLEKLSAMDLTSLMRTGRCMICEQLKKMPPMLRAVVESAMLEQSMAQTKAEKKEPEKIAVKLRPFTGPMEE